MLVVDIVRGLHSVHVYTLSTHKGGERGREGAWKQVGEEEAGVEEEGRARKGCGH